MWYLNVCPFTCMRGTCQLAVMSTSDIAKPRGRASMTGQLCRRSLAIKVSYEQLVLVCALLGHEPAVWGTQPYIQGIVLKPYPCARYRI